MDYNNLKNIDKQKAGVKCYDILNYVWGTIKAECGKYLLVENEAGTTYYVDRENIYPIAENLRLDRDREQLICYEINNNIEYPYYCPEYDEDEYEFEVVDITTTFKGKALESVNNNKSIEDNTMSTENNSNTFSINVGKKNARLMADMLIATLEQLYRQNYARYYDVEEESAPIIYFVRNYIDRIYNTYKDNPEIGVKEIYKPLKDNTLDDYLDDIFCEEVLHTCHRVILGVDLIKKMPNEILEDYIDEINALRDDVLLLIYNGDEATIADIQKHFSTDWLKDKYLYTSYNVKCINVQKYIVEVKATDWNEAKEKALSDMNKTDKPNNCRFVGTFSDVRNW